MASNNRTRRIAEEIRKIVSTMLINGIKDPTPEILYTSLISALPVSSSLSSGSSKPLIAAWISSIALYIIVSGAESLADKESVDIRTYTIIYKAIEDIQAAMSGLLDPEDRKSVV